MNLPLDGIRVLDLSRLLPGPYAGLILADLGAEVIKIEDTKGGDYIRAMPPHSGDTGAWFSTINRNKKSVSLDLKSEAGKKAFLDLAKGADVVLESFRPGVMERLGVGYDTLKAKNAALVYCAITGYGYDSPYRDRAGHDINYLAIAGVLGINGSNNEHGPQLSGAQIADVAGGSLYAVIAVLAALRVAESSGEGKFIDASMTDGAMGLLSMVLGADLVTKSLGGTGGDKAQPGGMQLNGRYACYNIYKVKDGYLGLGALEPKFWMNFCKAIERPDLLSAQFDDVAANTKGYQEVCAELKKRTRQEWATLNDQFDFCGEPILAFDELADNEHIRQRDLIQQIDLNNGTSIPTIRIPVSFEGALRSKHAAPPAQGEHTVSALLEAGWTQAEIQQALNNGALRS